MTKKNITLFFDMDGTIANFYGVENWLDYLIARNPFPYANAKGLINLSQFARLIHKAQRQGYNIGIISWLAKNSNADYDKKVTKAKKRWLKKHLPSVAWDRIYILPYGTPKASVAKIQDFLFDDELPNLESFCGDGIKADYIIDALKDLC